MGRSGTRVYEFGPFRADPVRRLLFREGEQLPVAARALELLVTLIEHRGRVLSKEELLQMVWRDTIVQEANLSQNVFVLRKLLGERPTDHRYILTVPGVGYRFVADVVERPEGLPVGVAAGHVTHVTEPSTRVEVRTIAVLPFRTIEGNPADEHIGLGLADALTTRLSTLRRLVVRPTGAVLSLPDASRDPLVAGRSVGADALLLGTMQRAGDRIRVTVQLVAVASEAVLWAERFDEKLTDLFSVEDSISEQVKRALILELTDDEHQALAKRHTRSTEAHQAYFRGRYFWNKRTAEGFSRAIEYFEQAIQKDPGYALAYAGIADCRNLLSTYGAVSPRDGYLSAAAAAAKALELDETLAEAHTALAYARLNYDWDFARAERGFQRALELMPHCATAHHFYADLLTAAGRFREALAEVKRAQELDPVSLIVNTDIAWLLLHARRYDEAIQQLHETLELDSAFWYTHWVLGLNYEQKGLHEEAIKAFQRAQHLNPHNPYGIACIGRATAAAGRREEARHILREVMRLSASRYVSPYLIATIHAALGDSDEAFRWLDRAYRDHAHWLMYVKITPALDSLRPDPRFPILVRRVERQNTPAIRTETETATAPTVAAARRSPPRTRHHPVAGDPV